MNVLDRQRLLAMNGGVDSLHDRNWANRMEDEGYLRCTGGDLSGARYYVLTDKGYDAVNGNIEDG